MAYYENVREYLRALEEAGRLLRVKQPVNKDTERGSAAPAFGLIQTS